MRDSVAQTVVHVWTIVPLVLRAAGRLKRSADQRVKRGEAAMSGNSFQLPPFPLEQKIEEIFCDLKSGTDFEPSGVNRELYLDLAERIVRQCLGWQDDQGAIISPVVGRETSTTTARFVGALAGCIWGGRCDDLVEVCALSMDYCCEIMAGERPPGGPFGGPEFYTKELMFAYFALESKVDEDRHRRWGRQLGSFDPWARYPSWRNWNDSNFPIYAVCGEQLKTYAALADSGDAIDAVLDNQFKLINPCGMYRDPNDPFTYDLTDRQQLGMLPHFGYEGRHQEWIDEATRRGGLTQLLYTSVTGQMPYGGRSNQYHIMEAMAATICEMEARRYQGNRPEYAGAFKRAAHLAAASVRSWIMDYDPAFILKNRFDAEKRHGDAGYDDSPYACYALLIASILGTAYQLADEEIAEGPTPTDRGGYVLQIWPSFHRPFATCGDCHIEIDNQGQSTHDATGLGRFHKKGVRPETALSMSIPAQPAVQMSIAASPEYAAIGPLVKWGLKDKPLAGMADSEYCGGIYSAELTVIEETQERVAFALHYSGDLTGAEAIVETYELTPEGLSIVPDVEGGELSEFVVPLLVTDGMGTSEIERLEDGFRVTYESAVYEVTVDDAAGIDVVLGQRDLPNINGIYRLGRFVGEVAGRRFHLSLEKKG